MSPISEDDSYLVGSQKSRLRDCQGCVVEDGEIHSLRQQCRSIEEQIRCLRAEGARLREEKGKSNFRFLLNCIGRF